MLVTLMGESKLESLTLPEKPAGRYAFQGYNNKGMPHPVLAFESRNGAWVVRQTRFARFLDDEIRPDNRLGAAIHENYPVEVLDQFGNFARAALLVEPSTIDRVSYDRYLVSEGAELTVGRSEDCAIRFDRQFVSSSHAQLSYRRGSWFLQDLNSSNGTYVNNVRTAPGIVEALKPGDVVFVVGLRIVIGGNFFAVNNPDQNVVVQSTAVTRFVVAEVDPLVESDAWDLAAVDDEAGAFYRSPRFKNELQTREFVVDGPPDLQDDTDMPLMQTMGPALVMGAAALFAGIIMAINTLSSGGSFLMALPMLLMSVSMIVSMALFPLLASRTQKKKAAEREALRQSRYMQYLTDTWNEIMKEKAHQERMLSNNFISSAVCVERALRADRALWERTLEHDDFLELRFGLGSRPLDAEVKHPDKHFSLVDDNLRTSMFKMVSAPTDLDSVPITVSLIEHRACGIIGKRDDVLNLVRNLVAQITALHSYDEVKLVLLIDSNEREEWDYLRFMPHLWSDDRSQRYFACGLQEAQELSIMFEKAIAKRAEELPQGMAGEGRALASPHYVVIAASKRIADRCGFISTLLEGGFSYGFSLVALHDSLGNLPKECSIVVNVDGGKARIYEKSDASNSSHVVLDKPVQAMQLREMSLALANTFLSQFAMRYEMPSVLTFMQMYGVGLVEHLDILTRWRENDPTISLSVPVGVDENGDLFNLDIHEKSHGPHGLVAGMTGSGKSEFIITLILSLAVNFSPDEIAFVLIDYKGGGLANAFDNAKMRLPHLAGTITNLDGAAINRSLVSIEAELKHRQVVFNEARALANEGTMDIYKYQQLYRQGVVREPLPHLLIISDEFAELKSQQPEFMDQLVSTARIGRSLGVHLILATQKPSGVVNDQIWSNAKFKVCLKVQDRADSLDMIRRPEAAELVETGRFYLQVGFNEYFAVGQSAWCGAPYYPSEFGVRKKEENITVIDDLGVVLREVRPKRAVDEAKGKQVIRIIEHIIEASKARGSAAVPLWLDPIPALIFANELVEKYHWRAPRRGVVEGVVGEYDDPARQRQGLLTVNLTENGNLAVYGSSGSGKSMLVSSLVYSLIAAYPPAELSMYLIDLGTESLRAFISAPHVGDVLLSSDAEKASNLFIMLTREIARRRSLFADYGGDYASYVRSMESEGSSRSSRIPPSVVVVIEGLAAFFELFGEWRDALMRITRDGARFGVYVVVTAETTAVVGFRMAQNFGQALALRLNDAAEYGSALNTGKAELLSRAHGAGVVKLHDVLQFQTAHPISNDAASDTEAVRAFCQEAFEGYQGVRALSIPTLPDHVTPAVLLDYDVPDNLVPFGVDTVELEPVGLDVHAEAITIVASDDVDELEAFSKGLLGYLEQRFADGLLVLDSDSMLGQPASDEDSAVVRITGAARVAEALFAMGSGEVAQPKLCMLLGLGHLLGALNFDARKAVEQYLSDLGKSDPPIIVVDNNQALSGLRFDPWFAAHLSGSGVWLGNGISEQGVVKLAGFSADLMKPVAESFGYVIQRGRARMAKMLEAPAASGEGAQGGVDRER